MSITSCKECGVDVSKKAKACPACGVKKPGLTWKDTAMGLAFFFVLVGVVSLFFGSDDKEDTGSAEREWYSGGTLHQENGLAWQTASEENRLATCADIVYAMHDKGIFKSSISDNIAVVDDLKPYATELKNALDTAFEKKPNQEENKNLYTNQLVSETAVMLSTLMGWLE